LIGTRHVLKKDSLIFHPGKIEVYIDPPMTTRGYTSSTLPGLVEQVHAIIAQRLADHSPQSLENLELVQG
jgi:hypothetical protein